MSAILIPFPQPGRANDDELEAVAEDLAVVARQVRPVALAWVMVDADGDMHSSWEALQGKRPALMRALTELFAQVNDLVLAEHAEALLELKKQHGR